jgi:hypothetical protein
MCGTPKKTEKNKKSPRCENKKQEPLKDGRDLTPEWKD